MSTAVLVATSPGLTSDHHGAAPCNALLQIAFCSDSCLERPSKLLFYPTVPHSLPRKPRTRLAFTGLPPDRVSATVMEPIAEGPPRTGTIRRLSPDEERQLFTQLRWLRRRAARRGVTLATDRTSAGFRRPRNSGEVMSEVARELNSLRQELAEAYFKLAVSVARGFANHPHEIDDLVGHASLTLLRAIDLYDVSRGFRFSTYATRALRTELSRYVVRRRKHELSIDPVRIWHRPDRGAGRNSVPPSAYFALEEMLDRLDPRERLVVRSRFGMADSPGAETLQSVAKRLGLSRERVRQLERGALAKLRDLADQPQYAERLQECTLGD